MHTEDLSNWQHSHVFAQDRVTAGERRTLIILTLTAVMMVVEIIAGILYGSMALLADGLHMASHATALGIAFVAYVAARRLAADDRFAFGTGKINSLAGFSSAILLLAFAFVMLTESATRLIDPVPISFDQALVVAVLGLVVNGFSAWLLASTPHYDTGHHDHHHGMAQEATHHHDHGISRNAGHHHHHHDHNLRAAYLHVLADAVTSLLAISALVAAKLYGANWLDPLMGIVGAILVSRWSYGLIRESARVLLDRQADKGVVASLKAAVEADSSDRVSDLHCWSIGHGILAAEISIVSEKPELPDYYRARIPPELHIVHATVEVNRCT